MAGRTVTLNGGGQMNAYLSRLAQRLGRGAAVNVGFLEGATYPADAKRKRKGGLKVAQVAFWNEFGTVRAPARPFFRTVVKQESPGWGVKLAKIAKATGYDSKQTLGQMGEGIKGQIVKSIVDWDVPGNAPYTIAKKGFDKPLIDSGVMQRAVDYVVKVA